MKFLWIPISIIAAVAFAVLLIAYVCYRMVFYSPKRKDDTFNIPEGEIYEAFRAPMEAWAKEVQAMPHEKFSITSYDGLILQGKFYEFAPNAPIELMFHGYRGSAERDLCGGVQRCFALGRSALIVDQRCHGKSEGSVITFGIKEHIDCLSWVDFMIHHFDQDVKIILTGISMGASTVLMAGGKPLPKNVIGILADCGYCAPGDIIKKVIRQMGLPVNLSYSFVKLGAKLYGHFDLEESSPVEMVKNCTVPVIFFHGESDDLVPWEMSKTNYDACPGKKQLVTIPNAGHGLSYLVDPETYLKTLKDFFGPEASAKQ